MMAHVQYLLEYLTKQVKICQLYTIKPVWNHPMLSKIKQNVFIKTGLALHQPVFETKNWEFQDSSEFMCDVSHSV